MPRVNTQQIGRCGELLVQYRLLLLGVESAPMTTDAGIDLVAFNGDTKDALTIQVKANSGPKPGGGSGKRALDWWIKDDCPADLVAFADLTDNRVWLFRMDELADHAQQHSSGRYHLYMYTDPTVKIRTGKRAKVGEFDEFLLEHRAADLLGVSKRPAGSRGGKR